MRAEQDLTKSLKLDPTSSTVWNTLGEWYYSCCRRVDDPHPDALRHRPRFTLDEARRMAVECFERGLEMGKGREGLLNLAMAVRAVAGEVAVEERKGVLERSVALCKEALALDVADGLSWFGLGSSYLKLFFSVTFDLKDLHRALAAYNKSANSHHMINHPDLYRNRAIINVYLENYSSAIDDFERSAVLDPLDIGPDSLEQIKGILGLLAGTSAAVKRTYVVQDLNGPKTLAMSIFNLAAGSVPISVNDEIAVASPCLVKFDVTYGKFTARYLNLRVDRPWNLCVNGESGDTGLAVTEVRVQSVV
ncbi:hypothetical protein BC829DRAFT_420923 [Chytridium lagenaria]|nr:hypothetical protein BC829DRAFT_420923 [Chytridium lagenaria]